MKIALRHVIPVLLGTALLTVAACDDGDPPSSAREPGAAARWTGFVKECPVLTGTDPGRRTAAAYDGPNLFSLRCQYVTTEARQKVVLNVTVYRAASGGSTAEQLAVATMEKDRATTTVIAGAPSPSVPSLPSASPSASAETRPIDELGDSAFARLVPDRGVRVYARSANAVVQLDFTDSRDGRKALTTATDLTRQALTKLH
ncbi:hypothetical protein [Actinoplanes sp. CA-252034]|uniref:hypothetical protein n=1 Tax=Actinoplanes sp. CA-252034 TaxID=3239906 RepID=UPI003D97B4D6